MTRDEITRMAREAGLIKAGDGWTEPHRWGMTEIERFAALVAAAEREACAKACESIARDTYGMTKLREYGECAAAIRARSN